MTKGIYPRPGVPASPDYHSLSVGATGNVEEADSDDELVERLSKRKEKQPLKHEFKRYFYGAPPPEPPDFRKIKAALAVFDKPAIKAAEEGTTEGVRKKLRRHVGCVLCFMTFNNKTEYLSHLGTHAEIREYVQFIRRAAVDRAAMVEQHETIKQQIKGLEQQIREQRALAEKFAREQRHLEKEAGLDFNDDGMPGSQQHVDMDAYAESVRRGGEELKKAQVRSRQAVDKMRWIQNQIERKQAALQVVEQKIKKFQTSPDTSRLLSEAGKQEQKILSELQLAAHDVSAVSGIGRKGVIFRGPASVKRY